MNIPSSLIIVAIAALIHASFQLSISVFTLLSSHAIGRKRSKARLDTLTTSFVIGVGMMTALLLSFFSILLAPIVKNGEVHYLVWTVTCGVLTGVGVAVWLFYYRKQSGTSLWVPRGMARYLHTRTKKTAHSAEAFSLGMASVVGELLFIFAPIVVSALILVHLEPIWQLTGIILYTIISMASLLFIHILISSGFSLSRIQKWRESNKHFLQFAAGSGLLALGFYIYVDQVVSVAAMAAAGGV